jgi:hypothetical protein
MIKIILHPLFHPSSYSGFRRPTCKSHKFSGKIAREKIKKCDEE